MFEIVCLILDHTYKFFCRRFSLAISHALNVCDFGLPPLEVCFSCSLLQFQMGDTG
jgi:hypothetical protein